MTIARAPLPVLPEVLHGPARLRRALPILRRLPAAPVVWTLACLAIVDGVCRRRRFRLGLEWAAAQGLSGPARWRLAAAVLANHGRFVAQEAMLGTTGLAGLRREVVIEGFEHLDSARGGAILLGFHLGPPRAWHILQAFGYPVRPAARFEAAVASPGLAAAQAGALVRLPEGPPVARTQGLHKLLTLLKGGALVYLTADGPFGREAFRVPLRGRPLIVRSGWLALRRQARVPTLPVLARRENGRHVIAVHPSLPEPDPDPGRDAAACLAALTPILEDYVRRFPAQCRYLVFPRWLSETADTSA